MMSRDKGKCSERAADDTACPTPIWVWLLSALEPAVKGSELGIRAGEVSNLASHTVCSHRDALNAPRNHGGERNCSRASCEQ